MTTAIPKPPTLRSGAYANEPATFGDISGIFKWLVENHVRPSLTSPPLLKDLPELTFVYDQTLNRLYTNSGGLIKYVQFS